MTYEELTKRGVPTKVVQLLRAKMYIEIWAFNKMYEEVMNWRLKKVSSSE